VFHPDPGSYGKWDYKNFVTGYLGIPLYLILIFGYKLWYKQPGIKPMDADLFHGKDKIDREEEEFLRQEALKGPGTGMTRIYRKYISWLF
jgi:amino acid transporter